MSSKKHEHAFEFIKTKSSPPKLHNHKSVFVENWNIGANWKWWDETNGLVLSYGGQDERGLFRNDLYAVDVGSWEWKHIEFPSIAPAPSSTKKPLRKKYDDDDDDKSKLQDAASTLSTVEAPKKDGHSMVLHKNENMFVFGGSDNSVIDRNCVFQLNLSTCAHSNFR